MVSETLINELDQYRIGPRIRGLRLKKKLGLVQLGEHTGLSAAMLSKIERGQLYPTLPTLVRIALVFGVGLEHFFNKEGPRAAVTRSGERVRLPMPAGASSPSYLFESLDYPLSERRMEAFLAEFPLDTDASEPHQHGKEEIVYILSGKLIVTVEDEEFLLGEGDAIYFDSSAPHRYQQQGPDICKAIVVTVE